MIKFEIKIFENTAFGHVTEVPIAHLIVFVFYLDQSRQGGVLKHMRNVQFYVYLVVWVFSNFLGW